MKRQQKRHENLRKKRNITFKRRDWLLTPGDICEEAFRCAPRMMNRTAFGCVSLMSFAAYFSSSSRSYIEFISQCCARRVFMSRDGGINKNKKRLAQICLRTSITFRSFFIQKTLARGILLTSSPRWIRLHSVYGELICETDRNVFFVLFT